ncbi:hypothetical protein JCM33374_g6530 [Metschnikowia sp. JCM 33374]|nr:hypothetical protein JCM33374_g6530 [Metschnikowia sp. JCM 33374]
MDTHISLFTASPRTSSSTTSSANKLIGSSPAASATTSATTSSAASATAKPSNKAQITSNSRPNSGLGNKRNSRPQQQAQQQQPHKATQPNSTQRYLSWHRRLSSYSNIRLRVSQPHNHQSESSALSIIDKSRTLANPLEKTHMSFIHSSDLDFVKLCVGVNKNGEFIATGYIRPPRRSMSDWCASDRTVRIWDLRSSQCSLTLSIEDGVTTVAVSPNGKLIAAGSLDKTVRVWDSSTGFLVERLDSGNESGNGHQDSVYSVAFSTNGHQLASGSLDRTVKLWNLEGKADTGSISGGSNGQALSKKSVCEVTYVGHKDFVLSVCSTPDSEYILSGSKDRGVIFWDQNSGNPLLMLQGHRNSVISVAVSLNSSGTEGVFATGSGDCKARLWRWRRN